MKKISLLIVFCLSILFMHAQSLTEVKNFAESNLLKALEMIPQGHEQNYGLESRADFMLCTVDEPLQMSVLSSENKIELQKYWRVPVVLDGKYRNLMTVILNDNNQLEIVGIGAVVLAENIQMDRNSGKKFDLMLRIYSHQMDFVGSVNSILNAENMILYPLHSAKNFIVDNDLNLFSEYKLSQIISIIHSTRKN